jgi:hypothetical protein
MQGLLVQLAPRWLPNRRMLSILQCAWSLRWLPCSRVASSLALIPRHHWGLGPLRLLHRPSCQRPRRLSRTLPLSLPFLPWTRPAGRSLAVLRHLRMLLWVAAERARLLRVALRRLPSSGPWSAVACSSPWSRLAGSLPCLRFLLPPLRWLLFQLSLALLRSSDGTLGEHAAHTILGWTRCRCPSSRSLPVGLRLQLDRRFFADSLPLSLRRSTPVRGNS